MGQRRTVVATVLAAALGVTALAGTPAGAAPSGPARRVIVELTGAPSAGQRTALGARHRDLVSDARAAGLHPSGQRSFTTLTNAVAMRVPAGEVARLRGLPGVRRVVPDVPVHAAAADDNVEVIGAPSVWRQTDGHGNPLRGKGITVAILDTGVAYGHPDLGGGFGPGHKVVAGYDVVNGDDDPADDNGHGSHVAGIIAGSGGVTGVAPDATLTAYKVLNSAGDGYESDIIAGLERAVDPANPHRADVVNLSLGGVGDGHDPLGEAATAAVRAGVVVVAAAGNAGPGAGTVGTPAAADGVIAVGASTTGVRLPTLTRDGEKVQVYRSPLSANPPAAPTTAEFVDVGNGTEADYAKAGDVRGKLVLTTGTMPASSDRITASTLASARRAEQHGALALVGHASGGGPQLAGTYAGAAHGLESGDSLRMDSVVVLGMDADQYAELVRLAKDGPVRATLGSVDATDRLADFSSRGPTSRYTLKPDLVAPGVEIRSTVPTDLYGPGVYRMSGTSMAAPHVAGAAALVRQAHPDRDAATVGAALIGSAHGLADLGPAAQGAGRLDVAAAVSADLTASPATLSLGLADQSARTVSGSARLTLHNASRQAVRTTLAAKPAPDSPGRVTVTPPSVRVPAGGSATVTVTVRADTDVTGDADLAGWVTAGALRVPYLLAERPLLVRASPDPSTGSSTAFVYSPTPLAAPPVVTVTPPRGRPTAVTAVLDHDTWYRAPLSGAVPGAYTLSVRARTAAGPVLAGTGSFEVTAPDAGGAWRPVGPNSDALRLTTDPYHDGRGAALASTSPAVWLTDDRGAHWRRSGRLPVADGGAGSLAYGRDALYYAVNGAGGGSFGSVYDPTYQGRILRSTDRGATWTTVPFPDTHVYSVATAGSRLVAVTSAGYAVSDDRGSTWTTYPQTWGDEPADVALGSADLFVATGTGVWVVHDVTGTPGPAQRSYTARDTQLVALAADGDTALATLLDGSVLTSADGGRTWTVRYDLGSSYPVSAAVLGDRLYVGATGTDFASTDGGASWSKQPKPVSGTVDTGFAAWPGDDAVVVSAERGGLFRTADAGATFHRIGVPGLTVDSLAVTSAGGTPRLVAGTESDTYATDLPAGDLTPDTLEWGRAREGLIQSQPQLLAVDPTDPAVVWKTLDFPFVDSYELQRSTDGGGHFTRVDRTQEKAYAVLVHPADPKRVLVSMFAPSRGYALRRTVDGGATWKNLYQDRKYTALAGDPADPDRLWLGAADGLYRSDDGGATVTRVATGAVTAIDVSAGRIVVGGDTIRVSTDGGRHFTTGSVGGLPVRVSALAATHGALYAATTAYSANGLPVGGRGVLRSTDGGRTWRSVSGGLTAPDVTSLAVAPDGHWLFAGTKGGGVYRMPL
ncbi:S8 family serine peptidase [Actinocatenispora rupis]|uniref:Peptidase S8/S53 domain-containing protein n=1 Tax=Actinocatenispora rupis TaxID=519421 RepID=A0A8J3NCN7_9ACTN|nr:S8 family serine peptidase [Actinocatenispora rupis]GID14509.1 hypothetical protein Aru02nite_53980 [Actinocatenispora rupis]